MLYHCTITDHGLRLMAENRGQLDQGERIKFPVFQPNLTFLGSKNDSIED